MLGGCSGWDYYCSFHFHSCVLRVWPEELPVHPAAVLGGWPKPIALLELLRFIPAICWFICEANMSPVSTGAERQHAASQKAVMLQLGTIQSALHISCSALYMSNLYDHSASEFTERLSDVSQLIRACFQSFKANQQYYSTCDKETAKQVIQPCPHLQLQMFFVSALFGGLKNTWIHKFL